MATHYISEPSPPSHQPDLPPLSLLLCGSQVLCHPKVDIGGFGGVNSHGQSCDADDVLSQEWCHVIGTSIAIGSEESASEVSTQAASGSAAHEGNVRRDHVSIFHRILCIELRRLVMLLSDRKRCSKPNAKTAPKDVDSGALRA